MQLRRVCLLISGFAISVGICSAWFVLQYGPYSVVNGHAEAKSLPMVVQGTDLLAEQILTYEGEYIEDTEFGEFVFVTGLVLRNTGKKGIVRTSVKLIGKDGVLEFDATYIPPGEAVLVLEKKRKETVETQFYSCIGMAEYDDANWNNCSELKIRYLYNNFIEITNNSDKNLTGIALYYKTFYSQGLFYIGGITHCYRIQTIAAGETVIVAPEYFAGDSSRIVHVGFDSVVSDEI